MLIGDLQPGDLVIRGLAEEHPTSRAMVALADMTLTSSSSTSATASATADSVVEAPQDRLALARASSVFFRSVMSVAIPQTAKGALSAPVGGPS